jgi:hypothetical protein
VGSSLAEYERVVTAGHERLAETLIARHTLRMDRLIQLPDSYKEAVMSSLAPVFWLDKILDRYGAKPSRFPSSTGTSWPDQLAWGVDSAIGTARLLLCGQFVGAAAVARNQLERWTMNRAHSTGTVQAQGESTLDYIARVWSSDDLLGRIWFTNDAGEEEAGLAEDEEITSDEPEINHTHVRRANGEEICPAALYGFLSEIMHGRLLVEALAWDADAFTNPTDWPPHVSVALGAICDTICLCLRQIRLAAAGIAHEKEDGWALHLLANQLDEFSKVDTSEVKEPSQPTGSPQSAHEPMPMHLVVPPGAAVIPLTPSEGLNPNAVQELQHLDSIYRATLNGRRPAGRLFRDDELAMLAFASHRAHSASAARWAIEEERRFYGEDFDLHSLDSRATRWVVLTESASVLGLWHQQPEVRAAAHLIGSGLRSAYWLWLEDDNRAMSVLRCVLEQTARMRTWRLKAAKAELLESRAETTPRDWLEAAGWRRLATLNKALGEFAHTKPTSRWTGAHELLAKLQPDADPDTAIYTARGASLDFISDLVAQEVISNVTVLSDGVARALVTLLDQVGFDTTEGTRSIEAQFNHIWTLRTESLGSSDFRPVTPDLDDAAKRNAMGM